MFWTKFLIPTSKEVPAEASAPSHQLMIRAGLIRQVAAGSYTYLPLGYRTLRKIEQIIREEMNAAGAVELHMPAMQPVELWEETGRVATMGETLVRLADKPFRKGTVLGPTHEEVVTDTVRAYVNSYKQLPLTLYQIQTKFRDEARPKSGVLRTREFQMKDAYSFDADKAGLDASYEKMYRAYRRIFDRCGLPYLAVEAESGPIGGDASHEFMVPTEAGEDYLVRSEDGSYAANLERAAVAPVSAEDGRALEELKRVHTPGLTTIDQVSAFLQCRPRDMIKTLIYETEDRPLVALVRGDHELNEAKLARAAGVTRLQMASAATIEQVTGAQVGFAGPVGLQARVVADQAVSVMKNAVTGANQTDCHVTGVNPDRDFQIRELADIRRAVPGDRSPSGSPLIFEKCIEVGHVFKLGTKYSAAMKATFLDEKGVARPFIMGCYGIGLNRIMAAAIEAYHDENGVCWPLEIAPFRVHVVALDVRDPAVMDAARRLHDGLEAAGIDVLLDDRDARPGFKFKDADLIGLPVRVVIAKRGLADGIAEVRRRNETEIRRVPLPDVLTEVRKLAAPTPSESL
ncbi:MAG: proline--tRNA ligase [Planctomycetota bacterium]